MLSLNLSLVDNEEQRTLVEQIYSDCEQIMYRTAFSILHNNQDAAALNEALSRLPENYREVLIMYYYHNMPLESVAGTFEISYEAAKSKLSGARNGSSRPGDNGK